MKKLPISKNAGEKKEKKPAANTELTKKRDIFKYKKNPPSTKKVEVEDKYPDTKKPFPVDKKTDKKEAGALQDRLNHFNQFVTQLKGAIDKFRSLVFEVSGTDKVIEAAKTGTGVSLKTFEQKDSPTPSREQNFNFDRFVDFFFKKLAPNNSEAVLQDLMQDGVATISSPILASLKKASSEWKVKFLTMGNEQSYMNNLPKFLNKKYMQYKSKNGEAKADAWVAQNLSGMMQDFANTIDFDFKQIRNSYLFANKAISRFSKKAAEMEKTLKFGPEGFSFTSAEVDADLEYLGQ